MIMNVCSQVVQKAAILWNISGHVLVVVQEENHRQLRFHYREEGKTTLKCSLRCFFYNQPSCVLFITFTYMGKCNLSEFQVEIFNILFAIVLYCNLNTEPCFKFIHVNST